MTGDGDGFEPSGYLREYARGNVDSDPDVHLHAGLVPDPEVREWLTWMEEHYRATPPDKMPESFWQTKFARKTLRKYGTEVAQRAVEEGQMHVIDYLTGMPSAETNISVMDTIDWLYDWVSRDAAMTLISGHMNTGKTNTALFFGELWKREFPSGETGSNIRSCVEIDQYIRTMTGLVEWCLDNPETPKLFIFDEAAATASSDLNDYEVKEQMRGLIRLMAKLDVYMIVIGHGRGGTDVNTEFRRFSHAVQKDGKKNATIYETVSEGRDYEDKLKDLTGIPATSWDYDPDDPADWMFDYDGEDLHVRYRKEVSDYDIDGYEEEIFDEDELEEINEKWEQESGEDGEKEEEEQCRGTTTDGTRCQKTGHHVQDNGYCSQHQDQVEEVEE